jgi:K+-sensing histidine kinase KdpD
MVNEMPKWTDAEEKLFSRLSERSPYYRANQPRGFLYLVALAIIAFTFLFVYLEFRIFGVQMHFPFLFIAMIICIRYCGRGPAWFAVVVSAFGVMWCIAPTFSLRVSDEEMPRLISNIVGLSAVILLWPRKSFGDLSYRLSAIHRRAMESRRRQKSSSSSSIGRPRVASRSTISP